MITEMPRPQFVHDIPTAATLLSACSTLALLLSPWALIALLVSMFTDALLSANLVLACALMLLAAMPKLLQLLIPRAQIQSQQHC